MLDDILLVAFLCGIAAHAGIGVAIKIAPALGVAMVAGFARGRTSAA